jgi:hypothetical protein
MPRPTDRSPLANAEGHQLPIYDTEISRIARDGKVHFSDVAPLWK